MSDYKKVIIENNSQMDEEKDLIEDGEIIQEGEQNYSAVLGCTLTC